MIYAMFQGRPGLSYWLLGPLFAIGVAEAALAGAGVLSDKYDWILGCLLFGTTATWPIAAALAGVTAPMSQRTMKYAYGVLTALLLIFVSFVIAILILDSQLDYSPLIG